uniref:DNA (cytosine-5-)-methyltransferase n=1 Tax=Bosea sp. NBC_00436 TaxID=2969620 RepID=A0A9E7ZPY6_9HYPH
MRVAEVCCGAGGMSLGLRRAGMEIAAAYDIWPEALAVYRDNFPRKPTLLRPPPGFRGHHARSSDLGDLLRFVPTLMPMTIDLIAGGPPCQDFSRAGRGEEGDRANMTVAFAMLIAVIRPEWLLFENVQDAVRSTAWKRARLILQRAGYGLSEMKLDASQHGTGQKRTRFIVVGRLGEIDGFLNTVLEKPKKAPRTSVRDILGDDVGVHPGGGYPEETRAYFMRPFKGGQGVRSIDEPCPTIIRSARDRASDGYVPHKKDLAPADSVPSLSWQQLAELQGFPASWNWSGAKTVRDRDIMIANALPAPLAESIGRAILARHKGDSVPELESGFIGWLMAEKGYAGATFRNRCSQVNRARRLLKGRIFANVDTELAMLQRTKEFVRLNTTVRSDLLGALSLHAEWRTSLRPSVELDIDDFDDGENRSAPVLRSLSERLGARSVTVDVEG